MPRTVKPAQYLYAIREKATKKLLNKKSGSANPYYSSIKSATNKLDDKTEEIVVYKLSEINI